MKKIIAIILGVLVLAAGLIGCASCKPDEPDPHEGLYGTYKMVDDDELEVNGKEIGGAAFNGLSQEVIDEILAFIQEIKAKAGDTITITKDTVKFSGGSIVKEFEYEFHYSSWIFFDNDLGGIYYPFSQIRYDSFENFTPTKYQLMTSKDRDIGEKAYSINFFYSR